MGVKYGPFRNNVFLNLVEKFDLTNPKLSYALTNINQADTWNYKIFTVMQFFAEVDVLDE